MHPTRRLFFALSLPENVQQEIVRWRADHFPPEAGRPVAAANLHLTLAFLGEVSAQKEQALRTLAGRIGQPGFTLNLNDAGQWPRPGVVWMGCRQASRGLLQLADLLRSQAARNGCHQSAQPFHPHITLLRGATRPVALPPADFNWSIPIRHFSLYQSLFENGRTRYQAIASWPLTKQK
ncbi:2'-5' RNA ligase [Brenneria goodwinii]|uniref:RNA 2',3'-cyclic phosphodiesterase n=1 Tax=Brenneria goodwinii TaxID=1109412 RepID=A0A0G4JWS1_9GAMM|nr:RNA 2',3'-cyclic phosphodiesterase [Brenneria goodwinii]ATA22919.1 2'-5' RNA ligase [Brenneria goodwinii]MCG8157143.1 RNA 2',3'-cyclic phosphodiesterase [Brenneria goodwinii]MCG8160117.1 RNA 2',3'-cyclic phosphodiesterase [Brenneria goodwinii]MCG8164640.1 RNA 2',3'-cyclic phosphodiesterase [Brenneria goodwinii]MCG8170654.1 RNA 2',3'-cyclic phosphodiesterase [Brenneria goodwinii]